jgi:hypothetical protein
VKPPPPRARDASRAGAWSGRPDAHGRALADSALLGLLAAGSLFAGVLAMSPLANRADRFGAWVHDSQHIIIVIASAVLGACLWDLTRGGPLARWRLVALGLVGVLAGVSLAHPWVRDGGGGLHFAQHGLVVTAAAVAGVVVWELVLLRRGGIRATGMRVPGRLVEAWRAVSRSRLPVAAVMAIALYVRLASLGFQSVTDDEGYSFALAQRSFTGMLHLFRWEGNGTIYSVVLWPIVRMSESADAIRLPALLAGTAAVGATYWAGRELASRRVALLGAFLLAVSPMAVRYAQFARPFSFALLCSALSVGLLARHLRTGGLGSLAGYAVVLALAGYSNSLAPVLLVPVHALLVAPAGWAAVRRLACAVVGATVLASPVIALALIETGRRDPLYWLERPSFGQVAHVVQEFVIGRAPSELGLVRAASVAGVIAAAALIAAAARGRGRRQFWGLFAWTFVPFAVALAISFVRPVFFGAYLIVLLPGLCLLLAAGTQRLSTLLSTGLFAVLAVAWLVPVGAMGRPPRVNDYRAAATWIASVRSAGDPVVVDPITKLPGYGYYDRALRSPNGYVVVKEWHEQPMPPGVTGFIDRGGYGDAPAGPPSAQIMRRLAQRTGRIVFIIDGPSGQGNVEDGAAARWMRGHCRVTRGSFGGIVVLSARGCARGSLPAAG